MKVGHSVLTTVNEDVLLCYVMFCLYLWSYNFKPDHVNTTYHKTASIICI